MDNKLDVLIGRLETINCLSEDKEIKQISNIVKELINIINKTEMGFNK